MTRVNIIPVKELTDQHLMAEYREILMVPASLKRTLKSKRGFDKNRVSELYTLNRGHVYHFFNKGLYLKNRYDELIEELKKRKYNLDEKRKFPLDAFPVELQNDWKYSEHEMSIAKERIRQRIFLQFDWYKYYHRPINEIFLKFYDTDVKR